MNVMRALIDLELEAVLGCLAKEPFSATLVLWSLDDKLLSTLPVSGFNKKDSGRKYAYKPAIH